MSVLQNDRMRSIDAEHHVLSGADCGLCGKPCQQDDISGTRRHALEATLIAVSIMPLAASPGMTVLSPMNVAVKRVAGLA